MESYCNKNKIVLSKSRWNDIKINMNEESEKMNKKQVMTHLFIIKYLSLVCNECTIIFFL